LRDKCRQRVFKIRVLIRIFGPKRDEITGKWAQLRREKPNDLYYSPNIVREMKSKRKRWAGNVARIVEGRDVCRVLVGKHEGKRKLG
jgi:hypothetical protein